MTNPKPNPKSRGPKPKGAVAPSAPGAVNDEEEFSEDFLDIDEDGGFPVAIEGFHHAKVIDFEKSESANGNPQYVWQFRITMGESKDVEIRFWTSLLPQARWKVAEALDAIGIPAAGSIAKFKKSDIVGKPCIIEVIHEEYEGKNTHKVKKTYPPDKDSIAAAKKDKTPF